jgi:LysR family transcriptional regulator, regulator for metE and metH
MKKAHEPNPPGSPSPTAGCIEVRHLRLVRAIAEQGSVTRAAGYLHLSQSAVSHQLVDLERDLATRLFDRVGRRMVPTAAGARLIAASSSVLAELSTLEQELHRQRDHARISLRVTTSCYVSYNWLPAALTHFGSSHPRLDLDVVLEATRRALPALLADEVDLAILTDPPTDPTWQREEIAASEIVALCSPAHPVAARARRGSLGWSDLRDAEILVQDIPDRYLTRLQQAIQTACLHKTGTPPAAPLVVRKIPISEALLELTRSAHGVAIVDHWTVPPRLGRDLHMFRMVPRSSRTFHAVWRRSNPRHLPLPDLAKVIRRVAAAR